MVWDHSTYSKNRDRLLQADIARKFLKAILEHEKVKPLLSDEHFTVDGTLINAWAPMKSFVARKMAPPDQDTMPPAADGGAPPKTEDEAGPGAEATLPQPAPTESNRQDTPQDAAPMHRTETESKGRNEEVDFHGQKRSNATHASITDAEARLFRKGKGKEAELCYMGHALTENRHGLVVEAGLTQATGTAEREAAATLLHAPADARRRQGLRHGRLRRRYATEVCDATRGAEREGPPLGHRWPHHAARGLRAKPEEAQVDRGGLRLDQDDRRPCPADAPRPRPHGLRLHLRDGRLRSHPLLRLIDGRIAPAAVA